MHPLIETIATYCAKAGIAETTFGNLALKDSRFVADLREGKVTLRRIQRVEAWIEANPPKQASEDHAA